LITSTGDWTQWVLGELVVELAGEMELTELGPEEQSEGVEGVLT